MKKYSIYLKRFPIIFLMTMVLFSCQKKISPVKINNLSQKALKKHYDSISLERKVAFPDSLHLKSQRKLRIDTLDYPVLQWAEHLDVYDRHYADKVKKKLLEFYVRNGFRTKWLEKEAPNNLYYTLANLIENSAEYGFDPSDYNIGRINSSLIHLYTDPERNEKQIAKMDVQVTAAFFLFTTHLIEGRIENPGNEDMIWKKNVRKEDDIESILNVNKPRHLIEAIDQLHPSNNQYNRMLNTYNYYKTIENQWTGEASVFSEITSIIKPGDSHPAIPVIRKRLLLTDLDPGDTPADTLQYDLNLVSAVKWFQYRHGLETDGIIGEETLKYLKLPLSKKTDLIALNLERLRWFPDNNDEYYAIINIPEFTMKVYEKGSKRMEMNVIVGKKDRPTPVFQDTLEYLVFNPDWTVPYSIIDEEIIPHLKKDSLFYSDKNYRFYKNEKEIDPAKEKWNRKDSLNPYQYKVVQMPGPANALGKVKFMMPNKMSIYLHDTPDKNLFVQKERALSHGCVRLSEPEGFARYLLKDKNTWDDAAIKKALNLKEPKRIYFKKKYSIQIVYRTVWIDENGLVNFRKDVYDLDKQHLQKL